MANPRVISPNTSEFEKLEAAAAMLEAYSPNNAVYCVEDVYFDFGQNWMWTTICRRGYNECQVLSPRDWELVITAETPAEIAEAVEVIRSDKYFGDIEKEEEVDMDALVMDLIRKEDEEATKAEYEKELMAEMEAEYGEQFEMDEDDIEAVLEGAKARHGEYADAFERACAEIQAENEARRAERIANMM